jgi:hypothetical protein
VLIRYPGTNGQVIEQRVKLTGTPARVGGWQWQFTYPDTKPSGANTLCCAGRQSPKRHNTDL